MDGLEAHDAKLAPEAFGLRNTGVICYFNSIMQAVISCTSFTRAVLAHAKFLAQTRTGASVVAFVRAYTEGSPPRARHPPASGIEGATAALLECLQADLRERRPKTSFGAGMQSAS